MKKLIFMALILSSVPAWAAGPELPQLTKNQLEKVSNEFAVNFSHTAVAAPETNGLWGIEVGILAGKTSSPKLAGVLDDAGEDGSDFKSLYHAGAIARAHFPLDLFAEMTYLPQTEISDVRVKNISYSVGWNAGAFFELPLDVAAGISMSDTDVSFKQVINNSSTSNNDVNSTILFGAQTRVLWVGVSKTFLFITPYFKIGSAKSESDVKVDTNGGAGTIFANSASQKENVSSNGGYMAAGANLQFLFLKFGVEASQTINVKRASAKLSFDF